MPFKRVQHMNSMKLLSYHGGTNSFHARLLSDPLVLKRLIICSLRLR